MGSFPETEIDLLFFPDVPYIIPGLTKKLEVVKSEKIEKIRQ